MNYLPNAFDPPLWYVVMSLADAKGGVFTDEKYADMVAERLNSDQYHQLIKVEDYLFLPTAIHVMIRERALTLDLWWRPFMDAILQEIGQLQPKTTLSWSDHTAERVADADAFEIRAHEMLFLPVWKGLATDPEGYPYNSVNNKAKIDL